MGAANNDQPETLLVDDEQLMLRLIGDILRKSGIASDLAVGPDEALQKLAEGNYRVVVSDIDMPGMRGFELAGRVRERHPLIQFIIVTAEATLDNLTESLRGGACDLLSKQDDLRRLPEVVGSALERAERWSQRCDASSS